MLKLIAHILAGIIFTAMLPVALFIAFVSAIVGVLLLYSNDERDTSEVWDGFKKDVEDLWAILLFILGFRDSL